MLMKGKVIVMVSYNQRQDITSTGQIPPIPYQQIRQVQIRIMSSWHMNI